MGILIISVGYGMYWYGKNSGQEIISKSSPSPTSEAMDNNVYEGWEIYTNNEYSFSFKYPASYTFEEYEPNDSTLQILINKNSPPNNFQIEAKREYRPENVMQLLDAKSNDTIKLNGTEWLTYISKSGYGDAGMTTSPFYGLQTEQNNVLYSIIFWNKNDIKDINKKIVLSFGF